MRLLFFVLFAGYALLFILDTLSCVDFACHPQQGAVMWFILILGFVAIFVDLVQKKTNIASLWIMLMIGDVMIIEYFYEGRWPGLIFGVLMNMSGLFMWWAIHDARRQDARERHVHMRNN